MDLLETLEKSYAFNRGRTLALLETIEKEPEPRAVLSWRPGAGRAHIGWQLMHVAITEEIFASERLNPARAGKWTDLWPRYRGGSTPDESVPEPVTIREILNESRQRLLETLREYTPQRLTEIPEAMKARGLRVADILHLIAWHEAHHQGQAHLTLNLYRAAQAG